MFTCPPSPSHGSARGLVTLVHQSAQVLQQWHYTNQGLQVLALRVSILGHHLLIANTYVLPGLSVSRHGRDAESFMESLFAQLGLWAVDTEGVLVMGDWNAHIGDLDLSPPADTVLPVVWQDPPRLVPGTCPQGHALVAHLGALDLCCLTGRTPEDDSQFTFIAPQGCSRVDHVFCQATILHAICHHTVLWDIVGSDHRPISFSLFPALPPAPPLCPSPSRPAIRWKPHLQDRYAHALQARLDSSPPSGNPDSQATLLRRHIIDAAVEVGMKTGPSSRRCGGHPPLWKVLFERHASVHKEALRQALLVNLPDRTAVALAHKTLLRAVRKVDRQHTALKKRAILESLRTDSSYAWKLLRPRAVSPPVVQDVHRWHRGLWDRFAAHAPGPLLADHGWDLSFQAHPLLQDFSPSEVLDALHDLPSSSAPGLDGISPAFLSHAHFTHPAQRDIHLLLPFLQTLFTDSLHVGMPSAWGTFSWAPLPKKSSEDPLKAYRLLSLTDVMYRAMMKILNSRLQTWLLSQGKLPAHHYGFYQGRNTTMPAFLLWDQIQHSTFLGDPLYLAFVDLTAAYDSVDRTKLWQVLLALGLPGPLVRCLQGLYQANTGILDLGPQGTLTIPVRRGLFQGCPLSPLLFNLLLHDLDSHLDGEPADVLDPCHRLEGCHLGYADDLVLLSSSPSRLSSLLSALDGFVRDKGLTISLDKTQLMMAGPSFGPPPPVSLHGTLLPWVDSFRYLGMLFTRSGDLTAMGRDRQVKAKSCLMGIFSLLHRLDLRSSHEAFHLLLSTMVLPTLLHGSELWGAALLSPSSPHWLDSFVARAWKSFYHLPLSTPSLPLLHELHIRWPALTWLSQSLKFFNRVAALDPSHPLHTLLLASRQPGGRRLSAGWLRLLLHRLHSPPFTRYGHRLDLCSSGSLCLPVDIADLRSWARLHWAGIPASFPDSPTAPLCRSRKHCTYYRWCYDPSIPSPRDLRWAFSQKILWLRLRLGAFALRVQDTSLPYSLRVCPLCSSSIQHLSHALLSCPVSSSWFPPARSPRLFWRRALSSPAPFFHAMSLLSHATSDRYGCSLFPDFGVQGA